MSLDFDSARLPNPDLTGEHASGIGYMRGGRVERIYREARVNAIGGGSEEIMRDLAARQYRL